jgi:glycosyltransferase involved in cell wall biosynthesis
MRVVYDISVLGAGHRSSLSRTGIYRCVENVAEGLVASGECQVALSAIESVRVLASCLDYLKENPALGGVPLLRGIADRRVVRWLSAPVASLDRRGELGLPAKVVRKALTTALRGAERAASPAAGELADADIFHSPCWPLPDRGGGVVMGAAQRFLTIHDLIPVRYPHWFDEHVIRVSGEAYRSITPADWALCVSQSTKNDLCEHFGIDPARVFVTHLAAAPELFHPVTDQARIEAVKAKYGVPDGPYVMSLNTLEPRKNMDHAIRAFTRLAMQEPGLELRFLLVGGKGWRYGKVLEALEAAGPVRDRIVVPGYVADEDLAALYSGASAFVYPSLYEGFGLPPLEAMQCGVPVITSNTSSLPEVVGDAGILLDPNDADGLSQAMLEVCSRPALRESMSAKSLERARQFSWERCTRKTLAAYRTALGR